MSKARKTIAEKLAELEAQEEKAQKAAENRQKKRKELQKQLELEKMKAMMKILEANGIKSENELKEMLERAKKIEINNYFTPTH